MYEPILFARCVELLSIIVEPGGASHEGRESQKAFSSLFFLYYSGTQGPLNQRLQVIFNLMTSTHEKRRRLGYLAMKAALESYYFDAVYDFEFGGLPRDHGHWPNSEPEARGWYTHVLALCEELACSDGPATEFARAALAEQFSSLWNGPRFVDELERTAKAIGQKGFWREGWLWSFGRGLAESLEDAAATWDRIVAQLASVPQENQKVQVLRGFLHELGSTKPELANDLLGEAVEHRTLSIWYPWLAASIDLDHRGVERLKRSLAIGNAPIWGYRNLSVGRASDSIPGDDFRSLMLDMAAKPDGLAVALDIVYMRLHSERDRKSFAPEVIDVGRQLLQQLKFTKHDNREDHDLEEIGKMCLGGDQGAAVVREVTGRLRDAVSKFETFAFRRVSTRLRHQET